MSENHFLNHQSYLNWTIATFYLKIYLNIKQSEWKYYYNDARDLF